MLLILLLWCFLQTSNAAAITPVVASRASFFNANDTALEIFLMCQCVKNYHCTEVNMYLAVLRADFPNEEVKDSIKCSHPSYVCCPLASSNSTVMKSPPTTETASTEQPSLKSGGAINETPKPGTGTGPEVKSFEPDIDKGCGIARTALSTRILNTEDDSAFTIPGEIPYIVAIFQKNRLNDNYKFKCAGTLIYPKVVMTASHCVRSSTTANLKIVATGKETFQNVGHPENERQVAKIIHHPQYYSGAFYNDMALLILKEEFDYENNPINSICLPHSKAQFTGTSCLAVGWGSNEKLEAVPLKKVDVPILNSTYCETLLRKTRLGDDFELDSSSFCAGGEAGKDTCKGDGGGPLICLSEDYKYVQVGIISWGVSGDYCGRKDQPSIYTDVVKLRPWIDEQLKANDIKQIEI